MLAIDFFGQAVPPPSNVTPPLAVTPPQNIIMPAVPDNTTVRCQYDTAINGFRCSPVNPFGTPTLLMIGAAGIALLGLGYLLGQARFLPRLIDTFIEHPTEALPVARAIRTVRRMT